MMADTTSSESPTVVKPQARVLRVVKVSLHPPFLIFDLFTQQGPTGLARGPRP
jgi:hypothetical protein